MKFIRLLACCLFSSSVVFGGDPAHEFDFWIGEWSVQNRYPHDDGSWKNGDVTRARITPVCGGMALLEEWAGDFQGTFMNGFSLRAYDAAAKNWILILAWTTDGNVGFGNMHGSFRHGRCELYGTPPVPRPSVPFERYTFSDALPGSVRWDSANSKDGGVTWNTNWIMEFTRTRAASEVTQDELFATDWTKGKVSPHAAARDLDWMLGSWKGTQLDSGSGLEREARLRCRLLDKDCLVLDVLETRARGEEDWDERLAVRAYVSGRDNWESWSLLEADPVLRRSLGLEVPGESTATFLDVRENGVVHRERLIRIGEDGLRIEESVRRSAGEEYELLRVTELRR